MNYFLYTSHCFTLHGRYELNKLTSLLMCGFTAELVEHRTGIAEVTSSNPVEALIFVRFLLSNCLNWKLTAMIILHFLLHHSAHANIHVVVARAVFLETAVSFYSEISSSNIRGKQAWSTADVLVFCLTK